MVPPAVQAMPREGLIVTRKGQDVTLRCSGRGNPNPRITWSKKVRNVIPRTTTEEEATFDYLHLATLQSGLLPSGYKTQEGLSLELQNVRRQDAGTYICTANNGVGVEASAKIQVEIKCKCNSYLIATPPKGGPGLGLPPQGTGPHTGSYCIT